MIEHDPSELAVDTCEQCGELCPLPAVDDVWLCAPCAALKGSTLRWRPCPALVNHDDLAAAAGLVFGCAVGAAFWFLVVGVVYALAFVV